MLHTTESARAARLGTLQGRAVWRFPVLIVHNDSRACATVARRWVDVTANTAAEAANWARDNECRDSAGRLIPETEIHAFGPRGGRTSRFIGWTSAIGDALLRPGRLTLNLF
jgi:hypothetical protein